MEKTYPTTLINEGREARDVYEKDGAVIVHLEPGQQFTIESRNSMTMYSRWSEVRWSEDGVFFLPRPGFVEPDRGRWVLELRNEGGEAKEWRTVGGERICLPKSVPVLIGLKLDDPLVRFKSLTIVRRRVMVKDESQPGYIIHEWRTKDELVPRSDSDLKALEKILSEKR